MAKEIKVTFEDGGVYEGFANTYTLDNSITYYFSFDRDYRVQLTNNAIILQEYRNAGAWYPIDIITKFELAEISGGGGGTGDVTQQWVKDNFVLKSGDTMSGALKFDFGNGVVFRIEPDTTAKRVDVTGNGGFYWENDDKKRAFSILSSSSSASINIYKVNNNYGGIWFRDYEYGSTGTYRGFSYKRILNSDTNSTWLMSGKFQTNNNWFFKSGVYFDAWAYWRSNDIINTIIQNNGGIRVYNDQNIVVHEMGYDAEANYYSVYKYNGRDTVSFVGGQDPRYRITGYNNFVNSVECYDKITVKTEGENTARLILSKGYLNTYDVSNIRRVYVGSDVTTYDTSKKARVIVGGGVAVYDNNQTLQFNIAGERFDIFHGHAVICHNGGGGGGTDDVQATFQYNGVRTYNYGLKTFLIDGSEGAVTIQSYISAGGTGVRINVPNGHYSLTESAGTVTGSGLYTTCNEFYYSESMLNALNACLGHIFDKIGASYYVQFSGQSYSTGGGKSRGGGVGRK
jgi:hypothetical protein